jgi:hypothetical protein
MKLDAEKVKSLALVLGADSFREEEDHYKLRLTHPAEKRVLDLELYPATDDQPGMAVVYTGNSHLQLHRVTGWVQSEELGEVTFVGESGDRLSGLVVERGASCSLYANVDRKLITGDFTRLGVEVMLSGVALSLVEDLLEKPDESD